jgi:hypothetical protein
METPPSPWLTIAEAADYVHRGELLHRREWIDLWVEDLATPVMVPTRRRA